MAAPPPRLAIILSHPVQYYSPWFRHLRQATPLPFRVFYLWDFGLADRHDPQFGRPVQWDTDLLSGYESEFVPNAAADPGTQHFRGLDNPALTRRLAAWRPQALLLFGYNWLSHQRALWWARRQGLPVILRSDSHLLGRTRATGIRGALLRLVFRQLVAALYVGTANREYLQAFGLRPDQLFFAPHAVDPALFNPAAPGVLAAARALRRELDLGDRRVALFAGKLHERKQPGALLEAFLRHATPQDALVFCGDGPERPRLEALARPRPDRCVRFLPFANQSAMPARYAAADFLVLPSQGHYETWGLAVNEAMQLGRPCLVSDRVGCQQDLVIPGETGWVFPANDHAALAQALAHAFRTRPDDLARLGANARRRIAGYTYAAAAHGLLAALAAVRPAYPT